jgi:hypothetical protein
MRELSSDHVISDLARMYALLARIPEGLEPLRKRFEEHVKKSGLAAVEKLVSGKDTAGANGEGGDGEEGGEEEGPAKASAALVRMRSLFLAFSLLARLTPPFLQLTGSQGVCRSPPGRP